MACACGKEDCKCSSNDLVPDKMAYQVNKRCSYAKMDGITTKIHLKRQ